MSAPESASRSSRPARITFSDCWMRWPMPGFIARDALVHLAQPADQRLHELDRAFRVGLGGGDELVVGGHQAFDVGHGLDGGRSRPRVDQAHLAEHVAGAERADALGLGAFADAHLDRTRDDEKGGVAGLAFGEDRIPGIEFDGLHRMISRATSNQRHDPMQGVRYEAV